jgi:hypothetical protein
MNDIALVINTISTNSDVWEMFFGQLDKHFPTDLKRYVFVDEDTGQLPPDCEVLVYDSSHKYQQQFTQCVQDVPEKYCIYISEDYILYEDVRMDLIEQYRQTMEVNPQVSFVRFMKGGIVDYGSPNFQYYENLYELSNGLPYFYTNQVALWRTRDLEKIHVHGPNLHIANKDWENSFEFQASKTCQELNIKGLYSYYGEKKRGLYHYDTIVFPHISTALVKGKWNLSEYTSELSPLLETYGVDPGIRGAV